MLRLNLYDFRFKSGEVPAEGGLLGIFSVRGRPLNRRVDMMNGMNQRAQGSIA
jgi:hypothetical protein